MNTDTGMVIGQKGRPKVGSVDPVTLPHLIPAGKGPRPVLIVSPETVRIRTRRFSCSALSICGVGLSLTVGIAHKVVAHTVEDMPAA